MEFLVLEVDGARFGVPTSNVREVLRAASLGTAPRQFPKMVGMLNYRGHVLGILELACLQGPRHHELTPQDHLIILQVDGRLFGLRVDRAVEIMTWDSGETSQVESPTDAKPLNDRLAPIAHPRLGVVYFLDARELWSELYTEQQHLEPSREVEAG